MDEARVDLAAIASAHGISGEVRLKLFTQGVEGLKQHKKLFVGDRTLTLVSIRPAGPGAVARFGEVKDRNAAEALRGQLISIPRSALPPLEEGEYYHSDIIGLPCFDTEGEPLGTVVAIEDFGAGDIIEIERPNGKRTMVPFRDGIADLEEGRIIVDPLFLA